MARYHALLTDEMGEEFGITFEAPDHSAAEGYLRDQYPESGVIQLLDLDLPPKMRRRRYR
jgi:hypothetical protein